MPHPPAGPLVILDFDGTLTERDGDVLLAEALLGEARSPAFEALGRAYERLEIGVSEYFRRYLLLLGLADPVTALAEASVRLALRPGLRELVDACRAAGIELVVASEGLDAYLVPALRRAGAGDVAVACNRLVLADGGPRVLPAAGMDPCARCLSCKATHVRRVHAQGRRAIVVGDGASDLCAARLADRVLARGGLCGHCAREGIAYIAWETLEDVRRALVG